MSARFTGPDGRRRLREALTQQSLIRGDEVLAGRIADCAELVELGHGDVLFTQGADDFDMAFVLSGGLIIIVNGRQVAARSAGQHVGEMALIDAAARRSATVQADGPCVVAKLEETQFSAVADAHPELWRGLARELAHRLRQRNSLVLQRRSTPHLFIGSSSEHFAVADAVADSLASPSLEVTTWKEDVFRPSSYTLVDLEEQAQASDFAVLVLGADDLVLSRDELHLAARDNVILELGLFIGACARERVFLLVPDTAEVRLPSDLAGITTLRFTPGTGKSPPDVAAATADIDRAVTRAGAR